MKPQFIDLHGKAVQPLPAFARDTATLVALYRWMALMRAYDAKAIALQRTGQIGTFASLLGQEAINAGIGSAMAKDDVFLMTYRENGAQLMRGVTLKELFLYWGGDERGCDYAGPRGDFPICITIAAHATHAAGVVIRKLDFEYARLHAGERVAVEADWKWRVGLLGRHVVIEHPGGATTAGRLRDMAFDGLEVENADGFVHVVAPETVAHIRAQG